MQSIDLSRSEDFVRWLRDEGAHHDLVGYVEERGEGLDGFWETCPRGDWMLALIARQEALERPLIQLAAHIAQLAKEQLPDEAALARGALDKLLREETLDDADIDALEAAAESQQDPAAHHAWLAVLIAARAHLAPSEVPNLVPVLVQAAVFDAGDCALMAVIAYVQRTSADIVRAHMPHLHVGSAEPQATPSC